MKLLNNLYNILQKSCDEQSVVYRIRFNKTHPIFQAHFPNHPVTPGACIIEIAKELFENHLNTPLYLRQIVNVKFIKTIEPELTPEVTYEFNKIVEVDRKYKIGIIVSDGDNIYSKQSLLFEKQKETLSLQGEMDDLKACIVLPTYNSEGLLEEVLTDFLNYTTNIIIVNDGSTDNTKDILQGHPFIQSLHFKKNRGKGFALNKGFDLAQTLGYDYAITVDSDTQHKAADLQSFLFAIHHNPNALIVGNRNLDKIPLAHGPRFANKFSNFWFWVQTGIHLNDTQTGYRAYPLKAMKGMRALTTRYEAELELLVRSAWKGIPIKSIIAHVYYPKVEKRISHFRPIIDFTRISLLNCILVIFAVLYGYPSMLIRKITK